MLSPLSGPLEHVPRGDGDSPAASDDVRLDAIAAFYWPSVESYASLGSGHVALAGQHIVGVTLWNVPGVERDSVARTDSTVPSAAGVASLLLDDRLPLLVKGMRVARGEGPIPATPYLHDLAVSEDQRGRGTGTLLLDAGLRDFGDVGAWLETTNPRNHSLYERAGFQAVHAGPVGESGVTMTRMVFGSPAERTSERRGAQS